MLVDGDEIDARDGVVGADGIPRRYDALVCRIAVSQNADSRPGHEGE